SVDSSIAREAVYLNRHNIANVITRARCRRGHGIPMSLHQANLNNSPDVVAVSIDPAFTSRTKLEQFGKPVLHGRSGIPDRILEVVRGGIGSSVRLRPIQLAKSRIIVSSARIVLNGRARIKCGSRTIRLADGEKWKMNILELC